MSYNDDNIYSSYSGTICCPAAAVTFSELQRAAVLKFDQQVALFAHSSVCCLRSHWNILLNIDVYLNDSSPAGLYRTRKM